MCVFTQTCPARGAVCVCECLAAVSPAESAAVYEIQLMAFNGNGDSPGNRRLVSLGEGGANAAGKSLTFDLTPLTLKSIF